MICNIYMTYMIYLIYRRTRKKAQPGDNVLTFKNTITGCAVVEVCAT